ncbi:MAG: Disulfide bond reductase DsbH [Chlamydiae bacterium]|nr:Disulfide bond reductase DsbH [Chlamydiota bacterium]
MKLATIFFLSCSMLFAAPTMTESIIRGREIAEGHNLPMALLFTGSDWSEESRALLEELTRADLPKEILFVHLDFPELNVQSQEILEENHALRERYQVHSFPTIILVESDEKEITRLGYPIPGVSNFLGHLRRLNRRHHLLQKRYEKARRARASGELSLCFEEANALGATTFAKEILACAVKGALSPNLAVEHYISLMKAGKSEEAKALRIELIKGGRDEILSRIALLDFQEEATLTPLTAFLARYSKKEAEQFWEIHLVISEFLLDRDEREEALKRAQLSYRHAPPEERGNISLLISKMLH